MGMEFRITIKGFYMLLQIVEDVTWLYHTTDYGSY